MVETLSPDLILLDIQMPGLDGFGVIEALEDPHRSSLSPPTTSMPFAPCAPRSAIVNLNRVQEVIPWFEGSHKLRLTTGAEVDLSRAQARTLRQYLGW